MTAMDPGAPAGPLVVAICTYNRPERLGGLFRAIAAQRLGKLSDEQILVVVIDNSETCSAESVCRTFAAAWRFDLTYVSEPRKGLSHARNAALGAAHSAGAEYLAFIDDDEVPDPAWLDRLHGAVARAGASAAIGPVYPIFEAPPPPWLPATSFATIAPQMDGFVTQGYTGNSIISISAIERLSLRFDPQFNETGGEDTAFFGSLIDSGGKVAWAENAIVNEYVPRSRMSARWLWKRWYRTGAVEAALHARTKNGLQGRLESLFRGSIRLVGGALRVAAALPALARRHPDRFVTSLYTLCRGAGYLAAAFGSTHREYSGTSYR